MEIDARNASNVYDETPPPLSGDLRNGGKATSETEFAGIQMRVREGRMPGRAIAKRSPPRSLSESLSGSPTESPTDSSLPSPSNSSRSPSPPSFRAPARSGAAAASGRAAMSLDDSLPWNNKLSKKELAKVGDDGYATPPSEWRLSPDVFDTASERKSIQKKMDDSNDGRHSAPPGGRSPRPQSTGGAPFSPLSWAGAWKGGTLTSPTSGGVIASSYGIRRSPAQSSDGPTGSSATLPRFPARPDSVPLATDPPNRDSMPILGRTEPSTPTSNSTSNASTLARTYVQTAIFADPGTLTSIEGTQFSSPSLMARLWRNVTYPPRALLSACRGLLQRMAGWFSGGR